jgi:alpha-L-rhamnosidase
MVLLLFFYILNFTFVLYMKKLMPVFLCLLFGSATIAQEIDPAILNKIWKAYWIDVPGEPAQEYGVYNFRKEINLSSKPSSFIVHVSADNRYKLFVNGKLASLGPARGDLFHWNFETVDIAPFLQSGANTIAAVVWNFGAMRPEAQISYQTGFILQGNSEAEQIVNTDTSWRCIRDISYTPLTPELIYTYYVAGPGEHIDMNQSAEGWRTNNFDAVNWKQAHLLFNGLPKGVFNYTLGWMLVPRQIPQMELTPQRLAAARKTEGINLPQNFPAQKNKLTIPANTHVKILFDQGHLTNAYPVLEFSKGKNASISQSYAEALYVVESGNDWRAQHQKGNRDSIEGKRFVGVKDEIVSSGKTRQQFNPLWWRTFRYLQLEITTKDEALDIDDIYSIFTGYPFEMKATFTANDDQLKKIMETGWRTARLCAVETYMDCPYYEQLQYVGDARIQCLVSLFNGGDDRLMRQAITAIDNSRMAEGLTLSRFPTANAQQIPPFSLWWIGILHDYFIYRNDTSFVQSKMPGMHQVLWFFSKYQQPDGSLKNPPYWNFTDWTESKGWANGMPPMGDGNSAALDLQLLWALQLAADLEKELGTKENFQLYTNKANQLRATIRKKYWVEEKQLFADRPAKDVFSQHTNTLAILTGMVNGNPARSLAEKILADKSLAQATIYFKYYVHQAITKAGLGDRYISLLDDWRVNLANGMTTWAEISDINRTRSDCHAWGASPNIEFLRIVLGINSDAPGFKKVKITPHPGTLTSLSGSMPHPNGVIKAEYTKVNGGWTSIIELPANVSGTLVWKQKTFPLKAGKNSFTLP